MGINLEEEQIYKKNVMEAHNITEDEDRRYICNDGDSFISLMEALNHAIYLDLIRITPEAKNYHELIARVEKWKK